MSGLRDRWRSAWRMARLGSLTHFDDGMRGAASKCWFLRCRCEPLYLNAERRRNNIFYRGQVRRGVVIGVSNYKPERLPR